MSQIYAWLGVSPHKINPAKLTVRPHESDSHYRHKYLHNQQPSISPPRRHAIPPRIQNQIEKACGWYYELFYPKKVKSP
jgi:sulfotransferase